MEIFIFILIYVGLLYVIYKFAESKNRESMGYTFAGLIVSPIIILIILAFLKKLPGPKKKRVKRRKT
jgi:heme/copper-type cytochrome/quinol oxidase subunit 2